jgi:hypothetical protein
MVPNMFGTKPSYRAASVAGHVTQRKCLYLSPASNGSTDRRETGRASPIVYIGTFVDCGSVITVSNVVAGK